MKLCARLILIGCLLPHPGLHAAAETESTTATDTSTPDTWYVIVSGIGGETHYSQRFDRWSRSIGQLISQYQDVTDKHVYRLADVDKANQGNGDQPDDRRSVQPHADDSTSSLVQVDARSTRKNILSHLATISDQAAAGDTVFILFIGHGSTDGGRALFNIPGPDLSAQDLIEPLDALTKQTVVLINTSASSSPFLQKLAEPTRIVITATSNPAENQHTYFGQYFIQALASTAADRDKDKRVSLLEAFNFASTATQRHYTDKGSIPTEHALLDDDGDGIGSTEPSSSTLDSDTANDNLDGARAARIFLHEGPRTGERSTENSIAFDIAARALVDEVESLKRIRDRLSSEEFDNRLEVLLLKIAKNRRDLRLELQTAPEQSDLNKSKSAKSAISE